MQLTNENIEARDTAVEYIKQNNQEQYAKEWKEDYVPTVDEELEEIRKKQEVEEVKRVVRLNTPHPVNIDGLVPRSMPQEERDLWDLIIMGPQLYAPGEKPKSREELYKEQEEQAVADFDAGTAEALMKGAKPENVAQWRAYALAYEKWKGENLADGPDNSYEWENANRKAFEDIMSNPELYQYTKTGDFERDYTNALLYDQILGRAIYQKTKDVGLVEAIAGQFFPETAAGFAGFSAGSGAYAAGPIIGTAVAGASAQAAVYQYRKSVLGADTSSVNSVGRQFLEEYRKLRDMNMNKIYFDIATRNLVDKYFTDKNRPYWGDLSTYIMGGEKDYLDMGSITSLLRSTGYKIIKGSFKGVKSLFRPKTKTEAINQAVADSKELQTYKASRAEGSEQPFEGEIISGKIARTDTGVNEGMSKEGITIDAESWTVIEPEGKTTHVFRDPKTGRIVRWGSYKSLEDGGYTSLISTMHKQDLIDSVSPSVGIKDIDSVIDGNNVMYIGTGADGVQPFESIEAVYKAIAERSSKIKSNQMLIPIEESTGQYYMGVIEKSDNYVEKFMAKAVIPENLKFDNTYNSVDNLTNKYLNNFEKNRSKYIVIAKDDKGQNVIVSYGHGKDSKKADSFIESIREGALSYFEGRRDLSARQKLDQFALQNSDRIPENVFKRAMYYSYLSSRNWRDTEKARSIFEKTGKKNQFKNAGLYGVLREDKKIKSVEDYLNVSIDNIQSLLKNKKVYWHTEKFNSFEDAKEYADSIKNIKDNLNIDEINEDIRSLFDSSESMSVDELLKNDGKHIKNVLKIIDNDRILKYNNKTKKWQFGEVRGFQ